MKEIFVDTNVIIDFLIDRAPFSDHAAHVFSMAESKKIQIHVSSLSFSNIYYVLRKYANDRQILTMLDRLSILVNILSVDSEVIKKSISSGFSDYEDAIQYFCAKQNPAIQIILSRDPKGFKNSDIAIMSAQDFLASV